MTNTHSQRTFKLALAGLGVIVFDILYRNGTPEGALVEQREPHNADVGGYRSALTVEEARQLYRDAVAAGWATC